MCCDSKLFLLLWPPLALVALTESSPDLEGSTVILINCKPTQNSLGLVDGVGKCFSGREWCLLFSIPFYKARPAWGN